VSSDPLRCVTKLLQATPQVVLRRRRCNMDLGKGALASLARLREYKSRRLSSWDRSGSNFDCLMIPPGECVEIGRVDGAGCVRHIWMTMASLPEEQHALRQTVLRMFWDGEAHPSVEAPVGDFFGIGFGLRRNFVSLPLQMSPQDGRGFNCWFPMPFATSARFEVENQGARQRLFYFYIDYEEHDTADPDLARFHAWWNRTRPPARRASTATPARTTDSMTHALSAPA
jgi:hypothetical protein